MNELFLVVGVGLIASMVLEMEYPIAPLVIGVILGSLFDETFRRTLLVADGDLFAFVSRPGAAVLLFLNVALILTQLPAAKRLAARLGSKVKRRMGPDQTEALEE